MAISIGRKNGRRKSPPRYDPAKEFIPGHDDPVRLVEIALDYFHQQGEQGIREEDDFGYVYESHKVWDAWYFLRDTLGLETENLWERWKSVPLVLSPYLNDPIVKDLYGEAARCYVFGQNASSIVLCRALLEVVLDRLYGIKGDGLADKIKDFHQIFDDLRSFNLNRMKVTADNVLHNFDIWRKQSKETEKLIPSFLSELKFLIEDAEFKKKR